MRTRVAIAWTLIVSGFVALYHSVLASLVLAWWTDDNYSHGFLVAPVAAYFLWERRARIAAAPDRPAAVGLLLILGSLLILATGLLGAELFLTRISILGTLAGVVLFMHGWKRFRVVWFPLAFLVLMIPLPAIIFNQIAFPLQLLASRAGAAALSSVDIPVLREGNVLVLANTTLEVAEACSGIRSLVSLLTLGIVVGYFADPRGWVRTAIALSSVPIAILANGARVAGTGIAAHRFGPAAAEGFFHEFSGWVLFIVAFLLMLGVQRLIVSAVPRPRAQSPDTAVAA